MNVWAFVETSGRLIGMEYTVKRMAELSGVSIRTLRYYDEVGLLRPARVGVNGYRYYQRPQLLRLQQILFYRELGLPLKEIERVLGDAAFDALDALESHRIRLKEELGRKERLIVTLEKTIQELKGEIVMKDNELFEGFDPKKQEAHEEYLVERYGPEMRRSIDQTNARVKNWGKEKWNATRGEFEEICKGLAQALEASAPSDSELVQALIRRHYEWLCQFWKPNRESYAGHSCLIVDSDLRNAYVAYHADLPEYVAEGIRVFAERELE